MLLFVDGAVGLVVLGLWVFCIFDVIFTSEAEVRNLPKLFWLFIVILLPDIGSLAWLIAGRPWQARTPTAPDHVNKRFPEYDRPGRQRATNPDDDEEFLRRIRERAEDQRRRAKLDRPARDSEQQPE